jgi:hypothetical protein
MIEYPFHEKASVTMRAAQLRDARTLVPMDEFRLTIFEEVGPDGGLPDSVRHVFTRAQLTALRGAIDGALKREVQ